MLQDEKIQRLGAEVLYTVCYQSALGVADQGDTPGLATRARVHELFRQIKADFDAGLVGQEFRWVWGRKPLAGEGVEGVVENGAAPPTPAASSTYEVSATSDHHSGGGAQKKGGGGGDDGAAGAKATPRRTHKRKSSLFAWVKDALAAAGKEKEAGGAKPAAATTA